MSLRTEDMYVYWGVYTISFGVAPRRPQLRERRRKGRQRSTAVAVEVRFGLR